MNYDDSKPKMNPVAALILQRLAEVLDRVSRLESQVALVAEDVDEIDRWLKPHGDGTRVRRGGR